MKKLFLTLFLSSLAVSSAFAAGGVVTGGGGGLINPRPADPQDIRRAIGTWGSFIIGSWFQRIRMEYDLMDSPSQRLSPFRKVFSPNFDLQLALNKTSIEVRFREACTDADGRPFDGSVYARNKNSVCISAFTTAPKLTVYNVEPEILALLAHEYSHLAGTDEAEAVAIQMRALDDFSRIRFNDIFRQAANTAVNLGYTENQNKSVIDPILNPVTLRYFDIQQALVPTFAGLANLVSTDGHFSFVDGEGLKMAGIIKARLIVAGNAVGLLDGTVDTGTRNQCQTTLDEIFQDQPKATGQEVLDRTSQDSFCREFPNLCYSRSDYDTSISRPKNESELKELLREISTTITDLRNRVVGLATHHVTIISD